MELFIELLPVLIPLILIEVGMKVYAIIDVYKAHRKVLYFSKTIWTVAIAVFTLGWLVYLLAGRDQ